MRRGGVSVEISVYCRVVSCNLNFFTKPTISLASECPKEWSKN